MFNPRCRDSVHPPVWTCLKVCPAASNEPLWVNPQVGTGRPATGRRDARIPDTCTILTVCIHTPPTQSYILLCSYPRESLMRRSSPRHWPTCNRAAPCTCTILLVCIHTPLTQSYTLPVESRIRPNGGFRETPGKLLTLGKPNPYPKSVHTPAHKLRKIPNI